VARFGRLDLLFNNAGTGAPPVPLEDLTATRSGRTVVDANLTGAFYCVQQAFRVMKDAGPARRPAGRSSTAGSISAYAPPARLGAVRRHQARGQRGSPARASLDGRKYDIAVGQIDIGNAATDMTAAHAPTQGVPQADGSTRVGAAHGRRATSPQSVLHMANLPLDRPTCCS
jgi:NAD(P)-dependent dehydrogenase (short-subunit alcohol dehydrogenase family)